MLWALPPVRGLLERSKDRLGKWQARSTLRASDLTFLGRPLSLTP